MYQPSLQSAFSSKRIITFATMFYPVGTLFLEPLKYALIDGSYLVMEICFRISILHPQALYQTT